MRKRTVGDMAERVRQLSAGCKRGVLLAIALAVPACTTAPAELAAENSQPPLAQAAVAPSAADLNPPVVTPARLPRLQETLSQLLPHRVIFVGETHTRYDHHLMQLEVLKYLHQQHGDVAIGVEWFQFPFQQVLDDYLAGRIGEAEMLDRTGYFDRWQFDWRLYRPVIQYAREHGIPVIALNAPAELTRKIGDVGLEGLSPEERAQLPAEYDRSDQQYAERIRRAYDQHPGGDSSFDRFLEVMLTWDETMAERAAGYLLAHPSRKLVVMAGVGHLEYGSGIPARVARRLGERGPVLIMDWDEAAEAERADYLVLSTEQELPPMAMLGAYLERGEAGTRVLELTEDSALRAAGVVKNDLLLSLDGQPVRNLAEVKLALIERSPGDLVQLRYRHTDEQGGSEERSVEIRLGGPRPSPHGRR